MSSVIRIRTKHRPRPPTGTWASSPLDRARAAEVDWQAVCPLFEAARGLVDVSYVYCIGEADRGAIKIGFAKDPITRLRSMQTGNPRQLCLEGVLLGDRAIETLLHALWFSYALHATVKLRRSEAPCTEWFRPDIRAELLSVVARAAQHQSEYVAQSEGDVSVVALERLVIDAHKASGIEAPQHDVARVLARGGGYVMPRPATSWAIKRYES